MISSRSSRIDQLHVEDRRFLRPGGLFDAIANVAEALLRAMQRVMKALDLPLDRVVGNDAMAHLRYFPAQKMHWADGNTG